MIEKIKFPDTMEECWLGSDTHQIMKMLNRIADHLNDVELERRMIELQKTGSV